MLVQGKNNYISSRSSFKGVYKLPRSIKQSTDKVTFTFETLIVPLNERVKNTPIKAIDVWGDFFVFTEKDVDFLTQFRKRIKQKVETGYVANHEGYKRYLNVDFVHSETERDAFAAAVQESGLTVQTVPDINALIRKIFK